MLSKAREQGRGWPNAEREKRRLFSQFRQHRPRLQHAQLLRAGPGRIRRFQFPVGFLVLEELKELEVLGEIAGRTLRLPEMGS